MGNVNATSNLKNFVDGSKEFSSGIITQVGSYIGYSKGESTVEIIIYIIIALVVVLFIVWAYGITQQQNVECSNLQKIYDQTDTMIKPIGVLNTAYDSTQQGLNTVAYSRQYQYKAIITDFDPPPTGPGTLFSYYVKTAYNCCSPGGFKNSFVDPCALKHAIQLGARCLDFEIYSEDYKPVVATSIESQTLYNSFYIKETFNSLPLMDVLSYIKLYALGDNVIGEGTQNSTDPLFLHLRIMTNEKTTINLIAKYLSDIFQNKLLGSEYSYDNYSVENFRNLSLIQLCNKCIVMVEYNSINYQNILRSDLNSLINLMSKTDKGDFRLLREQNLKTEDQEDMITFNKNFVTIVLPNLTPGSSNFDPRPAMQMGCQFVAMNFQNFDEYLEVYFKIFDEFNYSFVLKQCRLRNNPHHILIDTVPLDKRNAACSQSASIPSGPLSAKISVGPRP